MMCLVMINMNVNCALIRKQFSHNKQSFIHKLEIFIVCPNIPVLFLFKRIDIAFCCAYTTYLDFLFIVCLAVKRRININEVNFPAILL